MGNARTEEAKGGIGFRAAVKKDMTIRKKSGKLKRNGGCMQNPRVIEERTTSSPTDQEQDSIIELDTEDEATRGQRGGKTPQGKLTRAGSRGRGLHPRKEREETRRKLIQGETRQEKTQKGRKVTTATKTASSYRSFKQSRKRKGHAVEKTRLG